MNNKKVGEGRRGVRRRLQGVAARRREGDWKERAKGADGFSNEVASLGRR